MEAYRESEKDDENRKLGSKESIDYLLEPSLERCIENRDERNKFLTAPLGDGKEKSSRRRKEAAE